MAEAEEGADTAEAAPAKRSAMPLLVGVVLAIGLGGGGFYAAWSGLLPVGGAAPAETVASALPDVRFVALDPLLINLGESGSGRHLRFNAQLEVTADAERDVAQMQPRILDVLNGYLRAVELADLEDRSALIRLRAQMLRRVQVVVGEGRVRDLLVTEFVLN